MDTVIYYHYIYEFIQMDEKDRFNQSHVYLKSESLVNGYSKDFWNVLDNDTTLLLELLIKQKC